MPTWINRGSQPQRRRPPSGRPELLPQSQQSGLPEDYNAQLQTPGFTIGHVLETESGPRRRHPLDGDRSKKGAAIAWQQAVLSKIGMRGQIFTNFRVDVGITDTLVLPYNPARNYLIVVNTGGNTIFCSFERAADAATGVPIVSGGNYEPILGTVSSVHLVSAVVAQQTVIVEGFYTWAGGRLAGLHPEEKG